MGNLNEDLAILTTIPAKQLARLGDRAGYCIANAVAEARLQNQDSIEYNIGIGTLCIRLLEQGIQYTFKPSAQVEEDVRAAFQGRTSSLTGLVENVLVDRITNAYKDLI